MFDFLRRSNRPARPRRPRPVARHNRRLAGEALEPRLCLSAASVMMFSAMPTNNGTQVTLSGMVMDERPANVVLTFSGVAAGSVSPNAQGQFSLVTTASGVGQVTAIAVDDESFSSNPAYAYVMNAVPSVSMLSVGETGNGRWVTVSGNVMDEVSSGRTVTFGGVVSGTAVTGSGGAFSVSLEASALGTVTATTVDPWGQTSAVKQATLSSGVPSLSIGVSEVAGGKVAVSGTVNDMTKAGLTITIGGVASGTATTNSSGYFSVTLDASALGTVTATTQDVWGQGSNVAQASFTSIAPEIIAFTGTWVEGTTWLFTGTVCDVSPVGLTVVFSGAISGQTTTGANGAFAFYFNVPHGTFEDAGAQVTDIWGLESQIAEFFVAFA